MNVEQPSRWKSIIEMIKSALRVAERSADWDQDRVAEERKSVDEKSIDKR